MAVVRNRAAKEAFLNELSQGRTSHAYIVSGADGCGKLEFALYCAAALFCNGIDKPCGVCASCTNAFSNRHSDISVLGTEKPVTIAEVRDMIRKTSFTTDITGKRVFIMREGHLIAESTQNALLKIFEEPPAGTTIFLLTEKVSSLLATIRSRGRLIALPPESDDCIRALLEEENPRLSQEQREAAVAAAGGSLGKANEFLSKDNAKIRAEAEKWLAAALSGDNNLIAATIAAGKSKREQLTPLLDTILIMIADIMLVKAKSNPRLLKPEQATEYGRTATYKKLLYLADSFSECMSALSQSANINASLAVLVTRLAEA